jgi:peptidyl-dipeptidase Dcp
MKMLLATTAILSIAAFGTVAYAQAATAQAAPPASAAAVPNNILLADWSGPYDGVPPWDKVRPNLFPQAFQFAIDEQRREYEAIANNPAAPTFANTIEAMEKAGERLGRVEGVFAVMTDNMSTPEYQALDKEWQPKLAAASDEIVLNDKLFQRIKAVYDARESAGLDAKQKRLLERTYEYFVRSGANLDAAQKRQLSAMNQDLAGLFSTFNERVLADESTYISATDAEMKGVPADVKAALAAAAKERKQPAGTYAIKNTRSAVDPILTFADDR